MTWPLQNIPLFYLQKLWVAFAVCLVHHPFILRSAVQSTLLDLAKSGQRVAYIPIFCSLLPSSLHTSKPSATGSHARSYHAPHVHRWCCTLWIMSCSMHSPYFFLPVQSGYRLILISAVQKMLFQKWLAFVEFFFLAKSYLALFASCGEPSVFALMKSSLDCRLWQWHTCPLESVLLDGCCERGFLYHGDGSPTIHHCCPLWTSRPFCVAELSAFLFFSQNVPNCWFGHS